MNFTALITENWAYEQSLLAGCLQETDRKGDMEVVRRGKSDLEYPLVLQINSPVNVSVGDDESLAEMGRNMVAGVLRISTSTVTLLSKAHQTVCKSDIQAFYTLKARFKTLCVMAMRPAPAVRKVGQATSGQPIFDGLRYFIASCVPINERAGMRALLASNGAIEVRQHLPLPVLVAEESIQPLVSLDLYSC